MMGSAFTCYIVRANRSSLTLCPSAGWEWSCRRAGEFVRINSAEAEGTDRVARQPDMRERGLGSARRGYVASWRAIEPTCAGTTHCQDATFMRINRWRWMARVDGRTGRRRLNPRATIPPPGDISTQRFPRCDGASTCGCALKREALPRQPQALCA